MVFVSQPGGKSRATFVFNCSNRDVALSIEIAVGIGRQFFIVRVRPQKMPTPIKLERLATRAFETPNRLNKGEHVFRG